VGSSSERLDPTLDEGPNKLNARKLFIQSGTELLDFLHQWLRDLHLLLGKFVSPGHSWSKGGGSSKLLEPKVFASGELVLGVEPFRPPAGFVLGRLEIEVGHVRTHLATEAAGLVLQWVPGDEDSAPERPVGLDPEEAFTQRDEARNVKNRVGIQIMELNPICEKKPVKEGMRGKRESPQQESHENYPESRRRPGNNPGTSGERFRRGVLDKAHLLGLRQLLVSDFGLHPIANNRGVGIRDLVLLGGGAGGGAGRSGTPLRHEVGAWQELGEWRWMRGVAGAVHKEEDDGGGVGWTVYPSAVILFHL
jgi:hypothetical protein